MSSEGTERTVEMIAAAKDEAKSPRRRSVPDIAGLRRALGVAVGLPCATRRHLASLIGSSPVAVSRWERGTGGPSKVYRERLAALEEKLAKGNVAPGAFAPLAPPPSATVPTGPGAPFANVVVLNVGVDLAKLRFSLHAPGESEPTTVAEVLVPRTALARLVEQARGYEAS